MTPRKDRRELLVLAIMALVSSLIAIQFSWDAGKLAFFPFYDDVTYLTESQRRITAIYNGGTLEWVRSLLTQADPDRERSGLMNNLGVIAFMLMGRANPWAPYLALTVLVFAALVLLRHLFRGSPFSSFVVAAVAMLCVPVARAWTIEFRPDITWGFALALAALYVLSAVEQFPVGVGFGMAFAALIKPSILPVSLVVAAVAPLLAVLDARLRNAPDPGLRHAWRYAGGFAAGLAALGFSQLLGTFRYIYLVMVVAPEPWSPGGGLGASIRYYLTGPGGRWGLGNTTVLIPVVIAAAIVLLVRRRQRTHLGMLIQVLVLAALTYGICTFSGVKGAMLGSGFFAFVALAFFMSALELAAAAATGRRWLRVAIPLVILLPALLTSTPGPRLPSHPMLERGTPSNRITSAVNKITYETVQQVRDRAGSQASVYPIHLAAVSFGPLVSAVQEYWSIVENRPLAVQDLASASAEALRSEFAKSLCVGISDDAIEWIRFAQRDNSAVIRLLEADSAFEISYQTDVEGKGKYRLFCRH
jgi:hypothetical protein